MDVMACFRFLIPSYTQDVVQIYLPVSSLRLFPQFSPKHSYSLMQA